MTGNHETHRSKGGLFVTGLFVTLCMTVLMHGINTVSKLLWWWGNFEQDRLNNDWNMEPLETLLVSLGWANVALMNLWIILYIPVHDHYIGTFSINEDSCCVFWNCLIFSALGEENKRRQFRTWLTSQCSKEERVQYN